jgi:hypothetical protein
MFSTTRQSICQEKREVSGNSYLLILSIQLLKFLSMPNAIFSMPNAIFSMSNANATMLCYKF